MIETAFDALANERRRTLLVALLDENPQDDTVKPPPAADAGPVTTEQEAQVAMYHKHLPKLDRYGFIGWNRDTHEVVKGPQFEGIRPLLEFVDDIAEREPGKHETSRDEQA